MWDTVIKQLSVDAVCYQAESLIRLLDSFDRATYPDETCTLRDVFLTIAQRVRDELATIAQSGMVAGPTEQRVRKLGKILHELYSFLRFLHASDPLKTPPAIQTAITVLTETHFPVARSAGTVALVRPQSQYNLSYEPITHYLRDKVFAADLDPHSTLGADTIDQLIEVLYKSTSEKHKLPKHLAVLSFAGLDAHDTLLFPSLCHELGHFIDYACKAQPAGVPNDDRFKLRSESTALKNASFVQLSDFSARLTAAKLSLPPTIEGKHWTDLFTRISCSRREILADLIAVRIAGFGFFVAHAELLKTVKAWDGERLERSGYPGLRYRLEIVLTELLHSSSTDSLKSFLSSAGCEDAQKLLGYLEQWEARFTAPPSPGGHTDAFEKIMTDLAVDAVERSMPLLRDEARRIIPEASRATLSISFFGRINALRNDIPPHVPGDSIKDAFAEILSAAWAYQLLDGDSKERVHSSITDRFAEYDKTCRLTMKAIELASFPMKDEQTIPESQTAPQWTKNGMAHKAELQRRLGLPFGNSERLSITPLSARAMNSCSIDVHLGHWFRIARRNRLPSVDLSDESAADRHVALGQEEVFIESGHSLVMQPGDLILGITLEFVALPNDLAGCVEGRSSIGRRGLIVATATQVAPGFHGVIVLELVNAGTVPLMLSPGISIAQMIFHSLNGPVPEKDLYRGRFYCQIKP